MDKNAIKKYAVWARNELIARIAQKAAKFGVLEKNSAPASADSINGVVLTNVQKKQRQALLAKITEQGYEQTIEEVAYTWFNRFIALRFMEVNNYLPSRVRVFTDAENNFKPEIMSEAINMDLDGINVDYIYGLKDANMDEDLFRYMLVLQCNALNKILPVMFQKLEDYTELLLPDNLLRVGSVIEKLVSDIPEEDWQDQVQIIGWLYQYYNTEPKDKVFANLKKNIKISKENIPAATQLFTPDWIVRYMVENSLGRLWVEGHPNDELKANWKYYLEEAKQELEVQVQLEEIRKEYAQLQPEDLLCIDPCQGSGHILCYMFDVLMQIYEAYGYTSKEAVKNIVEKNIWGLDIDERASQLAYFSVMMKARQYDRRFFSHIVQPNVFVIEESNGIDKSLLQYFGYGMDELCKNVAKTQLEGLLEQMRDAKEYGSIINVDACDWTLLKEFVSEYDAGEAGLFATANLFEVQIRLQKIVCVAQSLGQKYHSVITNPPYMGNSSMGVNLCEYLKKNYPDSKSDLFAVFIEACQKLIMKNGLQAMITQHAWLSLGSYEKLRYKVNNISIVNMVHLGPRAFDDVGGEMVQTTSFVLQNTKISQRKGVYYRLVDADSCTKKEQLFLRKSSVYFATQDSFVRIPSAPITAYVACDEIAALYQKGKKISDVGEVRIGMGTGSNDTFLRLWWEVDSNNINYNVSDVSELSKMESRYVPYSKGGERKRWYGNHEYVVWYDDLGRSAMNSTSGHRENGGYECYFHKGMTWSYSTMAAFCARVMPSGFVFDVNGSSLFMPEDYYYYTLGFLQSSVGRFIIDSTKSAFSIQAGTIRNLPIICATNKKIDNLVEYSIKLSKEDWDFVETSWDFECHPLIVIKHRSSQCSQITIAECYSIWNTECNARIAQIKSYEEEINREFIEIYGLGDVLRPDVDENDITIRKADLQREIKSFIMYSVGCMFGRYSLDVGGLAYAGGDWNEACGIQEGDKKVAAHDWQYGGKYKTFAVDPDNIIPICDDEYFDDDIVGRFIDFVKTVYGAETLEENLKFIADALGGKGSPREIIRSYFLNSFYADHCKTYQKRPIYWLFDSGKKNGFKCLIYMHRYAKDTIARIRTDYVHEQQARYRTAIEGLETRIATAGTSERVKLNKQLAAFQSKAEELRDYEEKIHHYADAMIDIDLDDGVKVNYAKFADVLAKVK